MWDVTQLFVLQNNSGIQLSLVQEQWLSYGLLRGDHSRYSYWLRAGRPRGRSSSPGRVKNFLFYSSSRSALGSTQPPIEWVPGVSSSVVKRQGREADHSSPTSAEVKKIWIYISSSHTPSWDSV
jgi:hypothetical protein